jgi:peptidoglycan hydrolase-like protein with peptidoglycan-binding domain
MKRAFLLLTILSLATIARADDQTQAVQQALKDQGFYYAAVDGNPGPETDAAIRRYQIRQGLQVTGKLNAETLASLNLSGNAQPSADTAQANPPPPAPDTADDQQPTPPPRVVQSDRQFLQSQPETAPAPPAPAPDDQDVAPQPAAPPPPPPPDDTVERAQPFYPPGSPDQPIAPPVAPAYAQRAPLPAYADFFRKTPYEVAPAVVQQSTVRAAEARLGRQGFYRGIADGSLNKGLVRALADYQDDTSLKVTGRLDMETLASLNLLPQRRVIAAPPPPDAPPAGVYRGIWVH